MTTENVNTQAQARADMRTLMAKFDSLVADIAQMRAIEQAHTDEQSPEFIAKAIRERARADASANVAPQEKLPLEFGNRLYAGEYVWAQIKSAHKRSGLDIPKDSYITVRKHEDDDLVYRVWVDAGNGKLRFRKLATTWVTKRRIKDDGTEGAYVHIKRVKSPTKLANREHADSAAQAQEKMLDHIIVNDDDVIAPGTPVQTGTRKDGSTWYQVDVGTRKLFVSGDDVEKGVYVGARKTVTGTHWNGKTARQIRKHNASECTCTQTWLCPAAQLIGRVNVQVGALEYVAGDAANFDIAKAGDKLRGRMDKDAWELSDD